VRLDAVQSGTSTYSVIEDGKQFEAIVDERGTHGFDVLVGGRLFHLDVVDERTRLLASTAKGAAAGRLTVEAEMPGKVVKVSLAAGQPVREGQGVVVVEAMKMENEILSPMDGIVTEIPVSEGQTVETGAVLFVVEAAPQSRA
jgi:acetyl/propionyl-CoA carboxylase alpha subunit